MAWLPAVFQAILAVCVLQVTAQENPFSTAQEDVAAPAQGRRLTSALENFDISFKDSNGTDMQDAEEIDQIVLSFVFGSSAGNADGLELTVPGHLFTVGFQFAVAPYSGGGRRMDEGGTDAYGRRLSQSCIVQSSPAPVVQTCTADPSRTCIRMHLARGDNSACQAGDTVSATSLTAVAGSTLPAIPAGNYGIDAQSTTGSPPVAVPGGIAGTTVTVPQTNGVAISDPITFYKGKKTKFWLPLEGEHLLVQTPDLGIYASVFQGPRADLQWFDRFYLKLPDGRKVLEVGVKRESINQNSTLSRYNRVFNQLDIKLGNEKVSLKKREHALWRITDSSVKVAIGTTRYDPPRLHGQPITEYINVETASMSFLIIASHAGNEFPDDIELQKKHAHLDWITHEMFDTKSFTGILPQIWGVQQPLSAEVAAMLQSPTEAAQICVEV